MGCEGLVSVLAALIPVVCHKGDNFREKGCLFVRKTRQICVVKEFLEPEQILNGVSQNV
jgi:hypothetical protein